MKKAQKSFTLMELMLIVAIMGILCIAGALKFNDMRKRMKLDKAKAQMKVLQVAIKMYYADVGNFPTYAGTFCGLGNNPNDTSLWKKYFIDGDLDYDFTNDAGGYPTETEYDKAGDKHIYNWHGPYVNSTDVLSDPWGHRFLYKDYSDNSNYYSAIISQGPSDAVPDDISGKSTSNFRYAVSNIFKTATKDTLYPPDNEGFSIIPYDGDPDNLNSDYNIVLWIE